MPEASLPYRAVGSQVPTKQRLVIAAARLFALKGYNATSIDEIASACNIQKPSFYGHFPSKESIAIAALDDLQKYCEENLFSISKNAQLSDKDRILSFNQGFNTFFAERSDYALSTFLGSHLVNVVDNLSHLIQKHVASWVESITALLSPLCGAEEAEQVARSSIQRLQGAYVMERLCDDASYLQQTCKALTECWIAYL